MHKENNQETIENILTKNSSNLWQSYPWFQLQKNAGGNVNLFSLKEDDFIFSLYLKNKLPLKQKWLYFSRGPALKSSNLDEKKRLLEKFVREIKKENFVYAQIEFPFRKGEVEIPGELRKAKKEINPATTLKINLLKTEEEILSQMKAKGRYNIRLSSRKGVEIKQSDDIDAFYHILKTTKKRDDFGIHPKSYYQKMLEFLDAKLFLAYHKDDVLAGAILVFHEKAAIYYYGASSNSHRNLMAPYLLQWEMMRYAKKRGCENYDFLGIAPENSKNHSLAGVTEFKKKFGGEIFEYEPGRILVKKKFIFWVLILLRRFRKARIFSNFF